MKDLSLHILDIVQNSIAANATLTEISIIENIQQNELLLVIKDNGKGMSEEFLKTVTDPFVTTRTTRKVGLGLSLLKQKAEQSNGYLSITSKLNEGTIVTTKFEYNHIDKPPMGDIIGVIMIIISNSNVDFVFNYKINENEYIFDTREIKEVLGNVDINNIEIINALKQMLTENLREIGYIFV